ncbi:TrbI/VirB10 family protein [Mesorhizobium sp. M0816]|uniref:TrbI/VirB10 family protein n=1 Tax=Mesorhizobium sp. M0816 TaxID=2957006 RepID=UPI00333B1D63
MPTDHSENEVDFHTWQLIRGVVLATLLGVGTEHTVGSDQSDLVRAPQQSAQQSRNEAGQRLVEKNFNIQPTLTIRPGWPLRVIVEKDLVLQPYRRCMRSSRPTGVSFGTPKKMPRVLMVQIALQYCASETSAKCVMP